MKTIGLIGGVSPQSTLKYYEEINAITQKLLGGYHSAKLVLVNVNLEELVLAMERDTWNNAEKIILHSCLTLESFGVDCIALCCNTLHKVMGGVLPKIHVPFIHILDPIIEVIKQNSYTKVGILGSKCTIEHTFHTDYLARHVPGIEIAIPSIAFREKINTILLDELCRDKVTEKSIELLNSTVKFFEKDSVEAIILGCTELEIAFSKINSSIPVLDTTSLHAQFLANYANDILG